MGGEWVEQWSAYVKGLSHGGIRIGNSEETLLWMFDKKLGKVTIKRAYDLIVSEQLTINNDDFLLKVCISIFLKTEMFYLVDM